MRKMSVFIGLVVLLALTIACVVSSPAQPDDQAAFNTAVALTTQAQFIQMTMQAQASQPAPTAVQPTLIQPTVAQPAPTLSDEDLIRQALLAKLGWNPADMQFSLS